MSHSTNDRYRALTEARAALEALGFTLGTYDDPFGSILTCQHPDGRMPFTLRVFANSLVNNEHLVDILDTVRKQHA